MVGVVRDESSRRRWLKHGSRVVVYEALDYEITINTVIFKKFDIDSILL